MSPPMRFGVIAACLLVVCVVVTGLTILTAGGNPLDPASLGVWKWAPIVWIYVSLRGAMIIGRLLDRWDENGTMEGLSVGPFGKKEHTVDKRLAARRARVEAAQKRDKDSEDTKKETGNE